MAEYIIQLKASHFKDVIFGSNCECALARAIREQWGDDWRMALSHAFSKKSVRPKFVVKFREHDPKVPPAYEHEDFIQDSKKAKEHNFDGTVVRTITFSDTKQYQYGNREESN